MAKIWTLVSGSVLMGHNNLSGVVSQQFVSYRQEKVLQKFRRVIMFISIPHEVNYLTESDKNIPEPLLRASKKSFAPPQSFHFLFRSLREILCYPTACNYNSGMYSLENTR